MEAAVNETALADTLPEKAPVKIGGSKTYLFMKRVFDIIFATLAGILLLIPMAILAVLIRMDSEGPVLFRQERLGENGKPFVMYKFRSMHLDAEADGPQWANKNDDRCTKLGNVLRSSRLDEIPQLINILKGEMSFVGPRPERAYFYDKFEQYIPNFRDRLLVRPGLTGHAQVNGGYELLPEEKIVFDMEYIANRGVKMDLKCLLKTVMVMFSHDGAR